MRRSAEVRALCGTILSVPENEVDEVLALLCHTELAGGEESLSEAIAHLPREELERLLAIAVVELMDAQNAAEKQIARMARRLQERTNDA